jgi:integrase
LAKKKNPEIEYKCIHMLRHTFACLLLEATKDIKLVAQIMNWKSLKVAEVYADYLDRDPQKQGIKKLHNLLNTAA